MSLRRSDNLQETFGIFAQQREARAAVWGILLKMNNGQQKGVHKMGKAQRLLIAWETWEDTPDHGVGFVHTGAQK